MKNNNDILARLRQYFATTPREQVLADWGETKKYDRVGPTVNEFIARQKAYPAIHVFRTIPYEEVMHDRSGAYKFINFDNPPYTEDTFKTTE